MEQGTWEREDYRELLELVVILLGGVVKRVWQGLPVPVDVQNRKPGTVHQVRFMASCLYMLVATDLRGVFQDLRKQNFARLIDL